MAKFKIELELTQTEKILFSDFDSEREENTTITFNESLTEDLNDQYSLSFSIPEKLNNGVEVKNLISIGRPLRLSLYNPDKVIRMVITSFNIEFGIDNSIYNIEAKDYASHTFSRNNVGLNLDTFSDEDFWDWMDHVVESEDGDTTITNIGNYILERGWLRKREYDITEGWEYEGWEIIASDKTYLENEETKFYRYNISVSDSNTYNALVELANITQTIMRFDYDLLKIYFISKDDLEQLDNNYTLKDNFNIQDFGINYQGDNLYSIFYVEGGTNIDDVYLTLSDITEYKDNFLYNLEYYKNKGLITTTQYNDILHEINVNLKTLNENLEKEIKRKYDLIELANNFKIEIEKYSDSLILESKEDYLANYNKLKNVFESVSDNIVGKEYTETTRDFYINVVSLPSDKSICNFKFPMKIKYSDEIFELTELSKSFKYGPDIFIIAFAGEIKNRKFYDGIEYYVDNANFDENLFSILNITTNISTTITYDALDYSFPYLSALYQYDGDDQITYELNQIIDKINSIKILWEEDYTRLTELNSIIDPTELEKSEISALETKISKHKDFIGNYDPINKHLYENVPGKYTIIKKIFDTAISNFDNIFNKIELGPPSMVNYRILLNEKRNFWYELKNTYGQHIFYEGYYSNEVDTEVNSLLDQATAIFKEHQVPIEDFSITQIDISDIIGIDIQKIQVGDYVKIQKDKLEINSTTDSKLQVSNISRVLRENGNIQLSIIRYNMINKIIEKIIANSNRN